MVLDRTESPEIVYILIMSGIFFITEFLFLVLYSESFGGCAGSWRLYLWKKWCRIMFQGKNYFVIIQLTPSHQFTSLLNWWMSRPMTQKGILVSTPNPIVPITTAADATLKYFFYYFSMTSRPSWWFTWNVKNYFLSRKQREKIDCHLLQL